MVQREGNSCSNCAAFSDCLLTALDGEVIRCVSFNKLIDWIRGVEDAFAQLPLVNPLSKEEIEGLIKRMI